MNAIFLGLSLVAAAPGLKGPAKGDPPPIEGTWKLVEWLQGGNPVGFWDGMTVEFTSDGKRLCRESEDQVDERSYKLFPKTTPAAIDLIRPSGGPDPTVYPCICKVDGDTLVISVGQPGGERPKTFEPKADDVRMVMPYKRVKKEHRFPNRSGWATCPTSLRSGYSARHPPFERQQSDHQEQQYPPELDSRLRVGFLAEHILLREHVPRGLQEPRDRLAVFVV